MSITSIYIIVAIVSVAIGALLIYLAKLSSAGAEKEREKRRSIKSVESTVSLKQAIAEEVTGFVDSNKGQDIVAERVARIFDQRLEKEISKNTEQVKKKYESIISENHKSEQVVWKKYKRVLNEKKNTESVIRSIAEGLVVVDAEGNVMMINPAAEKLLGVSKKDKIGKSVLDNLKPEQLISLTKGSPDDENREIEVISDADDTKKILRASSAVIENKSGQTIGMVSVLSDVTKQKELDNLKSQFVANVSHELRTPLIAVKKSIALMLSKASGGISQTQEQLLQIAQGNLQKLHILIDDLLDISRLEAGKMPVKFENYSIVKVIEDSIEGLSAWAKTKTISVKIKIDQPIPDINIAPNRMIQVFNNLIGNAVKFTPEDGNIIIEVKLSLGGKEIEVSISDTGSGIPVKDLPTIFDKFYQVARSTPADTSGTGIGLAIVKEVIDLHNGKIWAESKEGEGAKFIFTLPYT